MSAATELRELYAATMPRVYGFVIARCGSPALAEDITSQVYVDAARAFAGGKAREVTTPWLLTVARNRVTDHWRSKASNRQRVEAISRERPPAVDDDSDLDDVVDICLASLPDTQRAALVLRYMDDHSVAEVADVLELSYQAAESLLARARRSFRTAFEAVPDEGRFIQPHQPL